MTDPFTIATIPVQGGGRLGFCPLPGRSGGLPADMDAIAVWEPDLVVTLTSAEEMQAAGAGDLPGGLAARRIDWTHLPIRDFGVPDGHSAKAWPELAKRMHAILDEAGKILVHCMGGKGRSGMVLYRVLIERGVAAPVALERLRAARPGAVETPEQAAWAEAGR